MIITKVTTRIEHPKEPGRYQDYQELIVYFGAGGEAIKYQRRVHDPDYPNGCLDDISAAQYGRFWAFAQKQLANSQVTITSHNVYKYAEYEPES